MPAEEAVVLAAGRGTRLGALTRDRPKPLVDVANRPMIEWIVESLAAAGVRRVMLNLHHLAPAVEAWVDSTPMPGIRFETVVERALSGPAGGLASVSHLLKRRESVLVASGDACTDLDLAALVAHHEAAVAALTVVTVGREDPRPFGQVDVDVGGLVTGMVRDPKLRLPAGLVSAGIYVLGPDAFAVLDDLAGSVPDLDFDRHLVPELLRRGARVAAYATDAYWSDVGTPDALRLASLHVLRSPAVGRVARPCPTSPGDIWCHGAHQLLESEVTGRVLLGNGVIVEPGAVLNGPVVLGAGVRVSSGARLDHAVVLAGAVVEPGEHVGVLLAPQ